MWDAIYFITISRIGLPQPSHLPIFPFMVIGPIFISWQSPHIIMHWSFIAFMGNLPGRNPFADY